MYTFGAQKLWVKEANTWKGQGEEEEEEEEEDEEEEEEEEKLV